MGREGCNGVQHMGVAYLQCELGSSGLVIDDEVPLGFVHVLSNGYVRELWCVCACVCMCVYVCVCVCMCVLYAHRVKCAFACICGCMRMCVHECVFV